MHATYLAITFRIVWGSMVRQHTNATISTIPYHLRFFTLMTSDTPDNEASTESKPLNPSDAPQSLESSTTPHTRTRRSSFLILIASIFFAVGSCLVLLNQAGYSSSISNLAKIGTLDPFLVEKMNPKRTVGYFVR